MPPSSIHIPLVYELSFLSWGPEMEEEPGCGESQGLGCPFSKASLSPGIVSDSGSFLPATNEQKRQLCKSQLLFVG